MFSQGGRSLAEESAVGGMVTHSIVGQMLSCSGGIPSVAGISCTERIDSTVSASLLHQSMLLNVISTHFRACLARQQTQYQPVDRIAGTMFPHRKVLALSHFDLIFHPRLSALCWLTAPLTLDMF